MLLHIFAISKRDQSQFKMKRSICKDNKSIGIVFWLLNLKT